MIKNLFNLVLNEMLKIYKRKSTWMMYLFLVVFIAGGAILAINTQSSYSENWKVELEEENKTLVQEIEEFSGMPGMQTIRDVNQESIMTNQFYLENDMKPMNYGAWQFVLDNADMLIIVSLFSIIIGATIISDEYKWGTIKLLMVRPYSRSTILAVKYLAILIFTFFTLLFMQLASFITGAFLLGIEGINPEIVAFRNGDVGQLNAIKMIISNYSYNLIPLIMMATLAFTISTIFKNSTIAISLAIVLMLSGNMIVTFFADQSFTKYLLFAHTDLQQYQNNSMLLEDTSLSFSITILIIYYVIFLISSFIVFNRKDIIVNE
ncbi:ABC transporter permease [Lacicoccus qingdaonensis]|uniref:ABC-2 type transport system permease protein n=1 Tax=Lacicoccus qingdaonensis TaxID=576118 RepID=A0A1G9G227_9BACL|nr:ABC transporter permease subunit [Salinicoccus qingdaonensis]SDK94710.1 ABC-2 type transport system permease protein [Salinicoccus qingdaonensis]